VAAGRLLLVSMRTSGGFSLYFFSSFESFVTASLKLKEKDLTLLARGDT